MKLKRKVINETYFYEYEYEGSAGNIKKGSVDIVFRNGNFNCANFNFSNPYRRHEWEILHDIRQEICRIEEENNESNREME